MDVDLAAEIIRSHEGNEMKTLMLALNRRKNEIGNMTTIILSLTRTRTRVLRFYRYTIAPGVGKGPAVEGSN